MGRRDENGPIGPMKESGWFSNACLSTLILTGSRVLIRDWFKAYTFLKTILS